MLPIAKTKQKKIFKELSSIDKKIDIHEKFLYECSWFQKKKKLEKNKYKIWFIRIYENFLLIYKVNTA